MSNFTLRPSKPSYIKEENDAIHIFSPITTAKVYKGYIGLHLPGLQKPKTPKTIVFTPADNISASRIQWSAEGATIHLSTTKGQAITINQLIGTLKCIPLQQTAELSSNGNITFFH